MDSVLGRAQAEGTGVKTAEPGWGRVSHIPLQMPPSITGGKTVTSSKQRCKALSNHATGTGQGRAAGGPHPPGAGCR